MWRARPSAVGGDAARTTRASLAYPHTWQGSMPTRIQTDYSTAAGETALDPRKDLTQGQFYRMIFM